jgi:nucleotide-binding universal stress UspA family protein
MFNSIVWAADGSEHAERALRYVQERALIGDGASITIIHVMEIGHGAGAVFLPRLEEEEQIVAQLEQRAGQLKAEGFNVALEVRDEPAIRPAAEIADIARATRADVIIAGTRGLSTIGGLILGSVTHRLLHLAPCPVLVVPADRTDRAA